MSTTHQPRNTNGLRNETEHRQSIQDRGTEGRELARTTTRGSALIDGKEWWVGLAKKTSKAGKVYLLLTFRPKVGETGPKPELDDFIPF